jgi:L-alanine-DL-glutamate epimerase-like enolase superfamily enzyme
MSVHREQWPMKAPFRINGKVWVDVDVVVCEIHQDGNVGRGEAAGVYYLGETAESMHDQIAGVASEISAGATRQDLLSILPPGGARNALDCALWDLEACLDRRSVWLRLNQPVGPLTTVMSIGVRDSVEEMTAVARDLMQFPVLKIKVDAQDPVARVAAIRAARPDASIVVDANQAFTFELLRELLPEFHRQRVAMLEQPLPRGGDERLAELKSPLPLCADESCLDAADLADVASRYQMINIKLDKTGGLTAALELARAAQERGLPLMVGNMFGTSLAMVPGFIIGQRCSFVDLDGPLALKFDRPGGMTYTRGSVNLPPWPLWGSGRPYP